jgi:chemotaxis protein CheX
MHVDEQQILSLSQRLWNDHFGLNIGPLQEPGPESNERTWSSCINISGEWQGALVLECPESIVRHAAAMLFATDGEETTTEDIEDALKELSVLIGKQMRQVLPEATKLSRPSIVSDPDRKEILESLRELTDMQLSCEGRPIRIALLARDAETAATA